jgi:tetratricopeptide (TPR) repeat protein
MSREATTDPGWLEWIEIQKAATRLWMQGNFEAAIGEINHYLAQEPRLDLRRQAIGFRGSIHEEQGDLEAARNDFSRAHELSEEPDFERYTLLLSLGGIAKRRGGFEEAENWFLTALQTAAADPKTSGAGALLQLLQLRGERGLTEQEHRLAEKVVYQGWSLLRVVGQPDLTDLIATAKKLIEAKKGPFSAERPPSPQAYTPPT